MEPHFIPASEPARGYVFCVAKGHAGLNQPVERRRNELRQFTGCPCANAPVRAHPVSTTVENRDGIGADKPAPMVDQIETMSLAGIADKLSEIERAIGPDCNVGAYLPTPDYLSMSG